MLMNSLIKFAVSNARCLKNSIVLNQVRCTGTAPHIADPDRIFPLSPFAVEVERRTLAGELDDVLAEFENKRKDNPDAVTHEMWESVLTACMSADRPFEGIRLYDEAVANGYFKGVDYCPEDEVGMLIESFKSTREFFDLNRSVIEHDAAFRQKLLRGEAPVSPLTKPNSQPVSSQEFLAKIDAFWNQEPQAAADSFRSSYAQDTFTDEEKASFDAFARSFTDIHPEFKDSIRNTMLDYFRTNNPPTPQSIFSEFSTLQQEAAQQANVFKSLSDSDRQERIQSVETEKQQHVAATQQASFLFNMLKNHFPHARDPSKDSTALWNKRWQFLQEHADKFASEQPGFAETTPVDRLLRFLRLFHDPAKMVKLRLVYADLVIREFGNNPVDWFILSSLGITPPRFFKDHTLRKDSLLKTIESGSPSEAIAYLQALINEGAQSPDYV